METKPGKLALTISPPQRLVGKKHLFKSQLELYNSDKHAIQFALTDVSNEYEIYPEFDLTGRLHYHGTIILKDKIKWYKKACQQLKNIGYICVKDNVNDGWNQYILKEWETTKAVLEIDSPIQPITKGIKLRQPRLPQAQVLKRKTITDYFITKGDLGAPESDA